MVEKSVPGIDRIAGNFRRSGNSVFTHVGRITIDAQNCFQQISEAKAFTGCSHVNDSPVMFLCFLIAKLINDHFDGVSNPVNVPGVFSFSLCGIHQAVRGCSHFADIGKTCGVKIYKSTNDVGSSLRFVQLETCYWYYWLCWNHLSYSPLKILELVDWFFDAGNLYVLN